jgi:hypothetical protein
MTLQSYSGLTSEELDRIECRVDAATQGPWFSYVVGRDSEAAHCNFIELGSCNEVGTFKSIELIGATVADQDFIANARQDLPRLLREVRSLRACLESRSDRAAERDSQGMRALVGDATAPRPSEHGPQDRTISV